MNYNFIPTDLFKREFKRLAKRYNSLKQDLIDLYSEMQATPQLGTDLGNGVRKIRMSIKSKNQGKSGRVRIITFNIIVSEQETISPKEIESLLVKNGLK